MKKVLSLLIIGCCVVGFYGCYYDKANMINPSGSLCDTTTVSYAKDIAPIMQASCASCHSAIAVSSGLGGSVQLDTYTSLKADLDAGWLLPAVQWNMNALPASASVNFTPQNMPQNLPKLNSCELSKISAWVNQGAKNN